MKAQTLTKPKIKKLLVLLLENLIDEADYAVGEKYQAGKTAIPVEIPKVDWSENSEERARPNEKYRIDCHMLHISRIQGNGFHEFTIGKAKFKIYNTKESLIYFLKQVKKLPPELF